MTANPPSWSCPASASTNDLRNKRDVFTLLNISALKVLTKSVNFITGRPATHRDAVSTLTTSAWFHARCVGRAPASGWWLATMTRSPSCSAALS